MSKLYEEGRKFFDLEEYEKALEIYSKGDDEGDIYCSFGVAQLLIDGCGIEKNQERANEIFARVFPVLVRMAEQGESLAQNLIASIYYNGDFVDKNEQKAIYWYEKSASNDNMFAQYNLAWIYEDGEGVDQDLCKAFQLFLCSAKKGYVKAQRAVGYLYYFACGTRKNYKNAFKWYLSAAEQGCKMAQWHIGMLYKLGKGVDKNPEKSFEWCMKSANKGFASAQMEVGCAYHDGIVVEKDVYKAFKFYLMAAQQGEDHAQYCVGCCYMDGDGVEINGKQAYEWWSKAAEQGHVGAQYNLSRMYYEGKFVKEDKRKSFQLALDAAKKGDMYAQYKVGTHFQNGYGEVAVSYADAAFWYKKAAKQGLPIAIYSLGWLYHIGEGVKKSYKKAFELYYKAWEAGYDARNNIALMYEHGHGCEQSFDKMLTLLKELLKEGSSNACTNLGAWYFNPKNKQISYKKAVYYFRKAIKIDNNVVAISNLATLYLNGCGVKKSYSKAVHYYVLASDNGCLAATFQLGEMYYYGNGIKKSYDMAVEYFKKVIDSKKYEYGFKKKGNSCYYLGDCYHHGFGVKPDWQKAKQYYQKAIELGYNCEYALDMVKIDLGEYRKVAEMEKYAQSLVKLNLKAETLRERISQDLREDFGESWDDLKENAKVGLITGVLTYITFISMGEEFCKQLDFSAVIVNFAKALEVELAEYFYKGYIRYLKKKGISAAVFPEDACFLNVKKEKGEEISREYQDEKAIKNFKLGGLKHIIDDKFEVMPSLEIAMHSEGFLNGRSEAYRKYKNFKGEYGVRTIDKHMLAYANALFSKEAFSSANRKKDIVNYLIDLSNAVGQIAYEYRNPAAHGDVMVKDKASACGDYLIKVRKLIYGFLSKIKKKYRAGYIVDVNKK